MLILEVFIFYLQMLHCIKPSLKQNCKFVVQILFLCFVVHIVLNFNLKL